MTAERKRRRPWLGFAPAVLLGVLAGFVVHGPVAGVLALATMLAFIGACIHALRDEDPEAVARGHRVGLGGWVGGWF